MNPSTSLRTKLAAVLAVPLVLALAGCEMRIDANISQEGELTMDVGVVDTDDMLADMGMTCEELFEDEENELADQGISEFTETEIDGHMACMATVDETMGVDGQSLIDNGDSYTFVMEGLGGALGFADDDMGAMMNMMGLAFAITMPGGIVEYTEGGALAGNTVTYSQMESLESAIIVTGMKSGEAGAEARVLPVGEGSSVADGAGERSTRQAPTASPSSKDLSAEASAPAAEGTGTGGSLDDGVQGEAAGGVSAGLWVFLGLVAAGLLVGISIIANRRNSASWRSSAIDE